jgi:microcystin-dependent protein
MMASTAAYRDDMAGAIVTTGVSNAYNVSSYELFTNFTQLNGQAIAFTPHITNAASPLLSVDTIGFKPIRSSPGVDLPAGVLIQGTPYVVTYNNTDGAFYLQGFFGTPFVVPLGGIIEFTGATVPNSSFVFPAGQAISRTTYASLFSLIAVTYGAGDGSTTFNVPDLTGRVVAMKEAAPNRLSTTYFGANSSAMGATGGIDNITIGTANLPPYTPSGSVSSSVASSATQVQSTTNGGTGSFGTSSLAGTAQNMAGILGISISSSFTGSPQGGTSTPLRTVQPTIILNKIMRVI